MRYALVIVEGPHDRGFVSRVFDCLGFQRYNGKEEAIDPNWAAWKPTYPKLGNLYSPLDMPTVCTNDDWSVGILVAGGSDIWAKKRGLRLRLKNNSAFLGLLAQGGSLAFVLDADDKQPSTLASELRAIYQEVLPAIPATPGQVADGACRVGTFVIPDNAANGTIESVLLPLGQRNHGPLLTLADGFVGGCPAELTTHFKPFDYLKARVAAAASILQPGATNTVTIEKDAWITPDQLDHPKLAPFVAFLRELLPEAA